MFLRHFLFFLYEVKDFIALTYVDSKGGKTEKHIFANNQFKTTCRYLFVKCSLNSTYTCL